MNALFQAVRSAASSSTWSTAVELSRQQAVQILKKTPEEVEARVATQGGLVCPLVTLFLEDAEWSCECVSRDDVCVHVAATAIALKNPTTTTTSTPKAIATLRYCFVSMQTGLALERRLCMSSGELPVRTSLLLCTQQLEQKNIQCVLAPHDLDIERILGGPTSGPLSRAALDGVLHRLQGMSDMALDQKSITLDAPQSGFILSIVPWSFDSLFVQLKSDPNIVKTYQNGAVLYQDNRLCSIARIELSQRELEQLRTGIEIRKQELAQFMTEWLPSWRKDCVVVCSAELPTIQHMGLPRIQLETESQNDTLHVLGQIVYGDPVVAYVYADTLHLRERMIPHRDRTEENRLMRTMQHVLNITPGVKTTFQGKQAIDFVARVKSMHDASVLGNAVSQFAYRGSLLPRVHVQGFDVAIHFDLENVHTLHRTSEHVSFEQIQRAYEQGDDFVLLESGGYAALPDTFMHTIAPILIELFQAKQNERLTPASAPMIAKLCKQLDIPCPSEVMHFEGLWGGLDKIKPQALPADLQASLRNYQQRGIDWLITLRDAEVGALLADDMGLGKTLQAIASIQTNTLVVAPTSVLFNWKKEIERFRPSLRVALYYGPERTLPKTFDVLLTSYTVLRLDISILQQIMFERVILDEAQTIKNVQSQVTQAAYTLKARSRLALSGTPIENRLDELWSLFHFLNPGLLHTLAHFKEHVVQPILAQQPMAAQKLREKISPFTLRRRKKDVALELPPKTEVVQYAELSENERQVYQAIAASTQAAVVEKIAQGQVLQALEALLRLRQAACHIGLVPGQQAQRSSKLELLLSLLQECVADQHKSLVFSQFTSLLDLMEPLLQEAGISYCRLDGSTRNRQDVVDLFQSETGPSVMLISLKAGGTGLNLTAADHVFLTDLWWNPAVEQQAADRAHRMGQTKPVLITRLIAANTIEEKILALQERKKALFDAAFDEDMQATLSRSLSAEELLHLVQDTEFNAR